MIAYNHERFVEQALNSVLAQRTNFDWEIVFGEDCSTDRTREIVQQITAANPDRIRLLLPEKNVGMMRNFMATAEACRGEYIAMLEGDDFWLDPDKLQKQVDFLDAHPELSTCFGPVWIVDESGEPLPVQPRQNLTGSRYTLAQFLNGEFLPRTCSAMYRRGLFIGFPEWFHSLPGADYALHVLNGQHGDFGFMNCEMAAYRVHSGGIWTQGYSYAEWNSAPVELQIRRLVAMIDLEVAARRILDSKYDELLRRRIVTNLFRLATTQWAACDWSEMRRSLWRALREKPWGTNYSFTWIAQALLVSHFPFISRQKR